MALATKHRTSIYTSLTPVLGEEEAEALLSQFPARETDEPATKDFVRSEIATLRAEIADFRGEVTGEFASVRTEIATQIGGARSEIASIRTEIATEIGGVRTEIGGVRSEIATEIGGVRTEIADLRGETRALLVEFQSTLLGELAERFVAQMKWTTGVLVTAMAAIIGLVIGLA